VTSDLDLRERRELCDRFVALGPDAPTLSGAWTTADLAAHLVVRERKITAVPGIVFGKAFGGAFARHTEALMDDFAKRHTYAEIVELVRSGPPLGPTRIRPLGHAANLVEFFVHHEDVRRANGETRRTDRPDLDDELWSTIRRMAPLMVRKARLHDVQLVLDRGAGEPRRVGRGHVVTLGGPPGELILELYGRRSVAEVTYAGTDAAVAQVRAADFSI
jgi:uncharacterized protein (TIGR03085 family)